MSKHPYLQYHYGTELPARIMTITLNTRWGSFTLLLGFGRTGNDHE